MFVILPAHAEQMAGFTAQTYFHIDPSAHRKPTHESIFQGKPYRTRYMAQLKGRLKHTHMHRHTRKKKKTNTKRGRTPLWRLLLPRFAEVLDEHPPHKRVKVTTAAGVVMSN